MSESTVIRNYQTVEVPPQGGAKCYDDDGRLKRTGNIWTASAHIITAVIGSGVLSLAWAIAQLGWIAGPVMMFLFSFVIYYTSCLLAECYRTGDPVTGKRNYTYMEAVRSNLGGIKFKVCGLVQYLNLFGIAIGYTIAASISMIWESATIFSLVLGSICYFGSQRFIGAVNGILIFGILSSFASLVGFASGNLQWDSLLKANFEAVPKSIPIIALSFVYQNVVPVLCTDLEGSLPKVRTAITVGTAIPLVLFLVWDAVILGNIPNIDTIADKIVDPIQQLKSINGSVGSIVEVFSFFAIATTYIGFVLGLTDFLADLLKLPNGQSKPLLYHVS